MKNCSNFFVKIFLILATGVLTIGNTFSIGPIHARPGKGWEGREDGILVRLKYVPIPKSFTVPSPVQFTVEIVNESATPVYYYDDGLSKGLDIMDITDLRKGKVELLKLWDKSADKGRRVAVEPGATQLIPYFQRRMRTKDLSPFDKRELLPAFKLFREVEGKMLFKPAALRPQLLDVERER